MGLLILSFHNAIALKGIVKEAGSNSPSVESTLAPTQTVITPNRPMKEGSSSPSVEYTLAPTKTMITPNPSHIDQPEDLSTFSPTMVVTSEKKSSEYFNYNPYSKWGPERWDKIKIKKSEYFDFTKVKKNQCNGRTQSPINIRKTQSCQDDHIAFTKRGKQDFDTIDFDIQPSSLRANLKVKSLSESAAADTSNLALLSKALFVDVKVPAEHTWESKQFAAELQITHHWDRKEGRFIILSVLLDDSDDQPNAPLEMFIREWEEEAKKKEFLCNKEEGSIQQYNRTYERPSKKEMKDIWGCGKNDNHCSKGYADWDVYRFIPTFWYCGYKGSLTIPPCTENVHWRIYDVPLKISKDQSARMSNLLVSQLDDECNRGSIAYNRTVSRPIQSKRQSVFCCKGSDFKANVQDKDYWKSLWPKNYHGIKGLK